MVTVGEIHTGLVQHATALSPEQCEKVLRVREGEPVLLFERPTAYAVAPETHTGVDCRLPSKSGRKVRGAGTIATRTLITGGRILQGSSYTTIGSDSRRRFWSHYLSQPGRTEAFAAVDVTDLRRGFLTGEPDAESLDIGAVADRAMDHVQRHDLMDRRPPMRAPRTSLRWTLAASGEGTRPRFMVQGPTTRTLELEVDDCSPLDVVMLCEDLAMHDWLLTTLTSLLNLTEASSRPAAEKVTRLRPVIEHLIYLWMPGARVKEDLMRVWANVEHRPGFTRQWKTLIEWARDQISVTTMTMVESALRQRTDERRTDAQRAETQSLSRT